MVSRYFKRKIVRKISFIKYLLSNYDGVFGMKKFIGFLLIGCGCVFAETNGLNNEMNNFAIESAKKADEFNKRYSREKKGVFLYQYLSDADEEAYQEHKSNLQKSEWYANITKDDSFNDNIPSYEKNEDINNGITAEENKDYE